MVTRIYSSEFHMAGKYVALKRIVFSKPIIFSVALLWPEMTSSTVGSHCSRGPWLRSSPDGRLCTWQSVQLVPETICLPVRHGKRFHNDGGHLVHVATFGQMVTFRGKDGDASVL